MKLYTHQKQALDWLKSRPKALLALDMGLGKTCISSVDLIPPALVVCPASLKLNWQNELKTWRPELSTQVIRGSKDRFNGSDVTIINYDVVSKYHLPNYKTLIVDEAHYCKNNKAKRTKLVCNLIKFTPRVRLLTGTPVVNRPIECWTLAHSIGATKLNYFQFGMEYCGGWLTPWNVYDFSGSSRQEQLVKLLEPVMLRMTKDQCIDLPAKTYRVISLDLPVDSRESKFDLSHIDKPDSIPFEAISDIRKLNADRKLDQSVTYIKDCLEQTNKVVVFAHHTHIIEQLMDALAEYKPVHITGSVKNEDRQKAVESFQNNPECRVFIGNIKAAGVGITLTAANHVVFIESPWSPAELQQAADRVHRISQTSNVTIDLLVIAGSIDELILHKVLTKMDVIDHIIKESKMNTTLIATKLRELADLFEGVTIDTPIIAQPAEEKRTKAKPEPENKAKAEPENKAKAAPEPEYVAEAETESITLDDLREAAAKLIGSGKREMVLSILKDFNANKISEILESEYSLAMARLKEAK